MLCVCVFMPSHEYDENTRKRKKRNKKCVRICDGSKIKHQTKVFGGIVTWPKISNIIDTRIFFSPALSLLFTFNNVRTQT